MTPTELYMWVGLATIFALLFMASIVLLIIISKKTHAIIEFKSAIKGTPMAIFFQDNRYCEWKNTEPEAGMLEDKKYGSFVIDSTYVDKQTKNVLIPFNSSFAMSLSAKAAKMADDLTYMFKQQENRRELKRGIIRGKVSETEGIDTLRTSINFSSIKPFVSPILPHNTQSKVVSSVALKTNGMSTTNVQNIVVLAISALGAIVLGGLVLKFMVF